MPNQIYRMKKAPLKHYKTLSIRENDKSIKTCLPMRLIIIMYQELIE